MSDGRARTLAAIRASLGRDALPASEASALERRLARPRANIVPARSRLAHEGRLRLFCTEAENVNATTRRLATWNEVPAAVADCLRAANLPATVRLAPEPRIADLPWSDSALTVATGAADPGDAVAITGAFAGVAETGTLVLLSGPESPTTLNFLPDVHIVALAADTVVGTYEDAWARLREHLGGRPMPRTVNWITGPSRTADIEQTLLLGAHGPRSLHILLVDGKG